MPITLADTRITVEFQGGDPKGDSWDDPFTLDDIVAASVAGSWDPAVTKQGIQYLIPYSLYIEGADTFFLAEDCQVYFEYVAGVDAWRLRITDCYFKSQGGDHGMSWSNDFVIGHNRLYIIPGDGYIENSKFTRFRYVDFGGSISNNLIIKKTVFEDCDLNNIASNNYVEVENITIVDSGANNIYPAYDFVSAENITMIDCPVGVYIYTLQTLNIRKLKLINVTNHLQFRPNKANQVLNCFDSNIDISSYKYVLGGTGDITTNNISTFKINIADGDGGTAKLYDKDDNLVFSEALSGELEKEVVFEMMEFDVADSEITKELLTTFEPFKLVVSKGNYRDLIIPDIIVNPGEQTRIFAEIVEPIYYQQSISGSVSVDEVPGKVETVKVTGTKNN